MGAQVFMDDAYASECAANVVEVNDRGGIVLDRTVFYATSGGQAGDQGVLITRGGEEITIEVAVYDQDKCIVHVPAPDCIAPAIGTEVQARLHWPHRHGHMRMHTCLHLLCSLIPHPVTGGSISGMSGRLDFDIPEAVLDKELLTEQLNELIQADHPVASDWITDDELEANPGLVRTMSVKPPMGTGRVRIVKIGKDGEIDLQPCGGTHVRSTAEIGAVTVTKIEKKGRQNRRVRLSLAD